MSDVPVPIQTAPSYEKKRFPLGEFGMTSLELLEKYLKTIKVWMSDPLTFCELCPAQMKIA